MIDTPMLKGQALTQEARLEAARLYVQVVEVFPDTSSELIAIDALATYLESGRIPDLEGAE